MCLLQCSMWNLLFLWALAVEGTSHLIFSGSNVRSVPFHHLHEGFVKHGYLAFRGFSTDLTLTCTLPSGTDGNVSIFKGPWSDPTPLVENGEVADPNDPNLSHSRDLSAGGGKYRISFTTFSLATSGTYYCSRAVRVSDKVTRVEVSLAELVVQATPEMFCFIHRITDSVIFTGETPPTPIHCVTDINDLRDRLPIRVDLIDPATGNQTMVDLVASFPSDLMPIFFSYGEVIFDISSADVANFDGFSVMCLRGVFSSNQCENIAPLDVYSDLTVRVHPENMLLKGRTSAEFVCVTSPNVIGNVTWSISGSSESEQTAITMRAFQTTKESILQLSGITFSGQESQKLGFTITCNVALGKGTSASASSTLTVTDDQGPTGMDMNNNDDGNGGPQSVCFGHVTLTILCSLLIQRLTFCT